MPVPKPVVMRVILNGGEPLPALWGQAVPDARFGTRLRHPEQGIPGNSERGDRSGSQQSLPFSA
jgi:hypothetical protein